MSHRARMNAWIGLVLIGGLAAGVFLAGVHARQSVRTRLAAALEGGAREMGEALSLTKRPDEAILRRLVGSFQGCVTSRRRLARPAAP